MILDLFGPSISVVRLQEVAQGLIPLEKDTGQLYGRPSMPQMILNADLSAAVHGYNPNSRPMQLWVVPDSRVHLVVFPVIVVCRRGQGLLLLQKFFAIERAC